MRARRAHAVRAALLLAWLPVVALAQQQQQGVCTRVKVLIRQELTLERMGFEATLEITNNDGENPITDFSAALTFENPDLSDSNYVHDASSMFFVRSPELEGISDVAGNGIIPPGHTAVARWFIIPKPTAGGTEPAGQRYKVGCQLFGKMLGEPVPDDVMFALPDMIFVQPDALLDITYFQPRDVQGDDPFTEAVETPVPFTLGVLVRNVGYGSAKNVAIHSEQPVVKATFQNLLLIAQLLGVRVMDKPLDRTSLNIDIGALPPGGARKAAWDMVTSLSGTFVSFNASYTHAPELGGEQTSIISNVAAHFIEHEVLNDMPGRDMVLDFLADTDRDAERIPDTLYESQGQILPVNYLANATVTPAGGADVIVEAVALVSGWSSIRVSDPFQARLPIERVVRSDNKVLNGANAWTSVRYGEENKKLTFLHLFDLVNPGLNQYTVSYGEIANDTNAPVTTLEFAGSVVRSEGKFYVTPETQMYFLSEDESPVSIFYALTNGAFKAAYPFSLSDSGEYLVSYFATDGANVEATNEATVVVSGGVPGIAVFDTSEDLFHLTGDALSVRPGCLAVMFEAPEQGTSVDAVLDVFEGVQAWPTVAGVPSTPTRQTNATLQVSGTYVDYYRYRLNTGDWSGDVPVAVPLLVEGLSNGDHSVSVQGRPEQGGYPDTSTVVQVAWTVDDAAPATEVTGTPATPSRDEDATLAVGGTNVTHYRWTINNGYYRAETAVGTALELTGIEPGTQVVSVIGKADGVWQQTNYATVVTWLMDPFYGYGYDDASRVRTAAFADIGSDPVTFEWDGLDDGGDAVRPGWYTLRLSLIDELGKTNFATRLVQVAGLSSPQVALVDAARGPDRPFVRSGRLVWQDQSNGHNEIYTLDLRTNNADSVRLTDGVLNQERARTDGRYVVWQGRHTDGSWDVYRLDLESGGPSNLTQSAGVDEINPSIDWPWVVYQRRAASRPGDPWLLRWLNLEDGSTGAVSGSTQDQLNPAMDAGRVVWQDWRDVGPGEIYCRDIEAATPAWRVTTNTAGQYHPAVRGDWIVWQDNRDGQLDIWGYHLQRRAEERITSTTANETGAYLDGGWLVCLEDSPGPGQANVRLVDLGTGKGVSLTCSASSKAYAGLTGSRCVWLDETGAGGRRILSAGIPGLQALCRNLNALPVTPAMADGAGDAFTLLNQWNAALGVVELARYSLQPAGPPATGSLWERVSARWETDHAVGDNFALVEGDVLWVVFDAALILDLGLDPAEVVDLPAGISLLGFAEFPSGFTAHRLVAELGPSRVRALRVLDAASGRWAACEVLESVSAGVDFDIPRVAVIMLEMNQPVTGWRPGLEVTP